MTEQRGGKGAGAVLGAATVATGPVAGVWFAYGCSVMPALARSDDQVYVDACLLRALAARTRPQG
ncbi:MULTISPECIES: hypothetical protein [unclassified Streptomyces]|uniref:hypothetical protein n=1 Tax=unclassified Streptomyces TaxID=2593676 RepID=UPI002967453C|nr:hypothetical protein [Streptomyces sp. SJL17-1]